MSQIQTSIPLTPGAARWRERWAAQLGGRLPAVMELAMRERAPREGPQ